MASSLSTVIRFVPIRPSGVLTNVESRRATGLTRHLNGGYILPFGPHEPPCALMAALLNVE